MRISDWSSDVCSSDLVTPEVKEELWSALTSLASAPPEERTLTGLSVLLQSNALKAALLPYTLEGPFGRLLDAAASSLPLPDVQCFETEALMNTEVHVFPGHSSTSPTHQPPVHSNARQRATKG